MAVTNPLFRTDDQLVHKLKLLEDKDVSSLLDELDSVSTPTVVGFLNQHGYNIAQQQRDARRHFQQMDYLLRDGIGLKLACWLNRRDPKANLNGSDFIPRLVGHLGRSDRSYQYFAMGTVEPWLTRGATTLFGDTAAFHAIDGFQSDDAYLAFFDRHLDKERTPVILLAMGMPRQEQVAALLKKRLDQPALIVCGGAILDFAANRVNRAPEFIRNNGLEWLYRLAKEPRRLFKRYAGGIPLFFYYLLRNGLVGQRPVGKRIPAYRNR